MSLNPVLLFYCIGDNNQLFKMDLSVVLPADFMSIKLLTPLLLVLKLNCSNDEVMEVINAKYLLMCKKKRYIIQI